VPLSRQENVKHGTDTRYYNKYAENFQHLGMAQNSLSRFLAKLFQFRAGTLPCSYSQFISKSED
jgi:hypothetical protein